MKSFLLLSVSSVFCVTLAFAQESLFPELDIGEEEETTVPAFVGEENTAQITSTEEIDQEINAEVPVIASESVEDENQDAEEENDEQNGENIFIALNNIRTNVAQVRAVSNCQADFVLFNSFKKRKLENFEITLTIGSTEKKFKFNNVAPQKPAGEHFLIVGADCENILAQPKRNITKCKIQGLTEKKCLQKVVYMTPQTMAGKQD